MKSPSSVLLSIVLLLASPVIAQEEVPVLADQVPSTTQVDAPVAAQTKVLNKIPDGTPSPPSPKPVWPAFRVKNTMIRHFEVSEAPEMAELPDMATSGPMFVIMGDGDDDPKAVDFLMGLHQLYQVEGARMERLFYARLKARNERKTYLLANPPKPKNLVMNYWRGKRTEPQTEGQ